MAFDADSVKLGRRGLLAGGGALGLTGALAACGAEEDESGTATEESGPWEFTDDRPEAVELEAVPTKIVAFTGMAAALYDFGVEVPTVFGPTTNEDGSPHLTPIWYLFRDEQLFVGAPSSTRKVRNAAARPTATGWRGRTSRRGRSRSGRSPPAAGRAAARARSGAGRSRRSGRPRTARCSAGRACR